MWDPLAGESLPRVWTKQWEKAPSSIALVGTDGRVMTNAELEEKSRVAAAKLVRAGIAPGDRLIFSARASVDFVVAYVAAHRLGVPVVPLNTGYTPNEIPRIVENVTPRGAVVDRSELGEMIRASSKGTCRIFGLPVDGPAAQDVLLDTADRHTPALICHTSGTTGVAKGAVLSSGNLLASAEAVKVAWRWTPEDRLLLALPLFHLHGLGVGINGTLTAGASAVLFDGFDPSVITDHAAQRKGSLFFGVPTMYHRIFESGRADAFGRLRLCVSGSAPLPRDLHAEFAAHTGMSILERYGMTETVMNVSNPYEGERRPGSIGIPLPGVDVQLDSPIPGEPGEIQIKGPNVFGGYWNQGAATASAFTSDGWFKSGDIGQWDADGYLRIVGRSKELIITGGYNVYPREVEETLLTHPSVREVAVVGAPSDEWGETVVAFVVLGEPVDASELLTFAAERLVSYKRPRRVEFVSELPRNDIGKVVRDQLLC
ncbi:MAG TPA: AMP-binding protein [Acidimicrobiales bacterium]|nr:AMP-binding protein [Acidimicrobiales bacterium]